MEELKSRQSAVIRQIRSLSREAEARRAGGLFLCDGEKLLKEALRSDAEICQVLWKQQRAERYPAFEREYLLPEDLFDYVSPMKNSPGPLFTVRIPEIGPCGETKTALLLEEIQDPGNLGTILRTADAFNVDTVLLLEGCADLYAPKTVRATMGAIFRQQALQMSRQEAVRFCRERGMPVYAAALSDRAQDLRTLDLSRAAVAIGSEGHGLSRELKELCDGEVIIPMGGEAESLNAAVAAAIVMWEMCR
ncbi:MAG: RNA methyltransferase [Oscillospiraceae bacterium]|nr:RNA methyltransferase [Oscillospiraceae bacterium]